MILTRARLLKRKKKYVINIPETEDLDDVTVCWTNRLEVTVDYLNSVSAPDSVATYKLRGNR